MQSTHIRAHGVAGGVHKDDRSPNAKTESDAPISRLAVSTVTRRIRVSDDARYLTVGQVKRRYGDVSDMWVWRHMRDHGFPRPIRFGGPKSARHWRLADVEQWERERARQNGREKVDA